MHDDTEVERVAVLMHDAYCRWVAVHGGHHSPGNETVPFAELNDKTQAVYRHTARAVLADLAPSPTSPR